MAEQESSQVHAGIDSDSLLDDVDSASCISRLLSSDDTHTAPAQDERDAPTPARVSSDHLELPDGSNIADLPEGSKLTSVLEKSNTAQSVVPVSPTRHPKLWKTIALGAGFLFLGKSLFRHESSMTNTLKLSSLPWDTIYSHTI
jgi:hypothetical protein